MSRLDPKWLLMRVKLRDELKAARRAPLPAGTPPALPPQPVRARQRH